MLPLKCRSTSIGLHGVTSQKLALIIIKNVVNLRLQKNNQEFLPKSLHTSYEEFM
jgi:hypothetical protein